MKDKALKRLNRDDRREQIIKAALLVFVEKGFSSTTTAEIAKAAEISEVTLFRYFSSKREIFDAGVEPILFKEMQKEDTQINESFGTEQVRKLVIDRIQFLNNNQRIIKLILNEPLLNQSGENYIHKMVFNLKSLLEKHQIQGDDHFIVRTLMGSFLSFLYFPEKDDVIVQEYADRIAALIISSQ